MSVVYFIYAVESRKGHVRSTKLRERIGYATHAFPALPAMLWAACILNSAHAQVRDDPQPDDAIHLQAGADLAQITSNARDGQVFILEGGEYRGPVVVRGIKLSIRGDVDGGAIIVGDARPQTVVVQVADGGNLTLSDVQLKFGADDQLGIYVSGAQATIERCSFHNPPSYGCYVQANGQLNVNNSRFAQFGETAIAISGGSSAVIDNSSFVECGKSAIHIQEGGTLLVDGCEFQTIAASAVVGMRADAIDVRNCRFDQIGATAVEVAENTTVVVDTNDFSDCQRAIAAVNTKTQLIISGNTIHDVPAQGTGLYVDGSGSGLIAENKIIGASSGIAVFGEFKEPVSLLGNLILNMSEGGIYVEAQSLDQEQPGAQINDNIVINCGNAGITLSSNTRATLIGNIVLGKAGMGVSIQQNSSASLDRNVIAGPEAAINIFQSTEQETSLHDELLIGSINTGTDHEPTRLDRTQRLDALLSLTKTGYALRGDIKRIIETCRTVTSDTLDQVETAIVAFRRSVAEARRESQQFAAVRLSFEDSIGRSVNSSFELYDGTSPTVGSLKFWAGDIKDAPSLVAQLQASDSGVADLLLMTADESVRRRILDADTSQPISNSLKRVLANELNRLIEGELLDNKHHIGEIPTDPQTDALRERVANFSADDLKNQENRRLLREVNRQLIESVFPYQIARGRSLVQIDSSDGWAYAPAGKYWLVPRSEPSLRQLVTLKAGERNDHSSLVDGSLWVQFRPTPDAAASWFLFAPRPKPEMKQALSWMRRPFETWQAFSLLRPEVKEADLAAARRLALKALPQAGASEFADYSQHSALQAYVMRILAVAGKAEDAQRIIGAVQGNEARPNTVNRWAAVIANLEARLGLLHSGSLVSLLDGEDRPWALAAAVELHQYGLNVGDAVLREHLRNAARGSWITTPAFALLDSNDPQTVQAMRTLLKRLVSEAQDESNSDTRSASVPAVLYLLAYGDRDDLELVSQVKMDRNLLGHLSFISDDPMSVTPSIIPHSAGLISSDALALGEGFLDRPAQEAQILYARLIRAIASHRASMTTSSDPRRGNPFAMSLNTSNLACSYFMPNRTAVLFYGRFGNTTPFEPEIDARLGMANLFGSTPWFAEPRFLERYVFWWYDGDRAFEHQMDYVDNDSIARAVDENDTPDKPFAFDLFMAAHRVSTRAYAHPRDGYPMGMDRRPYVLRHHGETSGGISGVAEMKYDWMGNELRVHLRLRQAAVYHASSFIDRTATENYEHYQYMINDGRALIDSIVLRREGKTITANDTKQVEDGFLIFEAPMDRPDPAGWYLDVNMNFLEQRFTLTYSLFASESARRHRQASSTAR